MKRKIKNLMIKNNTIYQLFKKSKDTLGRFNLIYYILNYKNFNKKLNTKGEKIFSMMEPNHGNIGDTAIAYSQRKYLSDNFPNKKIIRVTIKEYNYFKRILKKKICDQDIITTVGGGNMGSQYLLEESQRRDIIKTFENNLIISFPQSIYFKNDPIGLKEKNKSVNVYCNHKNLILIARDEISYDIMKKTFRKCTIKLMPDIVLYNSDTRNFERNGALLLLRDDVEKNVTDDFVERTKSILNSHQIITTISDTVIEPIKDVETYVEMLNKMLDNIAKSKLIITDRLHGMIFAVITSTPCIVMSNYNHKIKGQVSWLKDIEWLKYCESEEELHTLIEELLNLSNIKKYDPKIFNNLYNQIKEYI